jgi:hypothetical protein
MSSHINAQHDWDIDFGTTPFFLNSFSHGPREVNAFCSVAVTRSLDRVDGSGVILTPDNALFTVAYTPSGMHPRLTTSCSSTGMYFIFELVVIC